MIKAIIKEAENIITQLAKLGTIATFSTMANNIYRLQALSTMQHITTDIKQIPKSS